MDGLSLIGFERARASDERFQAVNPATGDILPEIFHGVSGHEVDAAAAKATLAARVLAETGPADRAKFLETIADEILKIQPELVDRAHLETALPKDRLNGETARTVSQLRLFAGVVRSGDWMDVRIETALPDRAPVPKPDIRSMLFPLGPVVVFGASNFPLAFSVAGGDTASALAAGNPVIVKAHPAHPGTSLLVGEAVVAAVKQCGLPEGVFSLLFGPTNQLGEMLVRHPAIKAVGFTGSRSGGMALARLAMTRREPIPVYAEMSSVNPLVIAEEALKDGEGLAEKLLQSVTLGGGQFCTKPGLVFLPEGADTAAFLEVFAGQMRKALPVCLLHSGIAASYRTQVNARAEVPGVSILCGLEDADDVGDVLPCAFHCSTATLRTHPKLADEIFGPAVLFVTTPRQVDLVEVLEGLEGQLTASFFCPPDQVSKYADVLEIMRRRGGRLIFNQFPTGVEVCHAMVHGGPFPATTDGQSTSVGTMAIRRFLRPACWQNAPQEVLPPALRDGNPLGLRRMINGRFE